MAHRRIAIAITILLVGITGFWLGVIWKLKRMGSAPDTGGPLVLAQFVDVGDGDASFIRSPGGLSVLIDCGPDDAAARETISQMRRIQTDPPKLIVLTSSREGSIGGLPYVLAHTAFHGPIVLPCSAERFAASGGAFAQKALDAAAAQHLDVISWDRIEAAPTLQANLSDGTVQVTPIPVEESSPAPSRRRFRRAISAPANDALAIRIDRNSPNGSSSILDVAGLLPADESKLVASRAHLTCDILAIDDGGGEGTASYEFLSRSAPSVAVVSGSPDAPPDQQTLERLAAAAARTERTDLFGTVTLGMGIGPNATVTYFGPHAQLPGTAP